MSKRNCSIDFANFEYPPAFTGGEPFRLINGEYNPPPRDDGMLVGTGYSLVSVTYGDVTKDKHNDAIVTLSVRTGGSATPHTSYVHDLMGGQPRVLWRFKILPNVEAATNRFSTGQGHSYDANGNITTDPGSGGRTFIFNGDNKQTEVKNSSNATIGTYLYDGNGKRVKKVTDLETTIFVYDGMGKLVAEYSTAASPSSPTINYTATDQLGSPRVLTDKFGQVISRRDFMAFGEELYADGSIRSTNQKYTTTGSDSVRKRFTGYEKDIETGLDFAEARYYQNQHGRFTAVDPLLASGKSADPQTFNRYVYAMNRPIILTDSSGLQAGREIAFGLRHPIIANEIGSKANLQKGTDIASVAARYAVNATFNDKRGLSEPTEVNALRHTILSAIITVRFGEEIAQAATNAHESDDILPSSKTGNTTFDNEDTADKEADLRNNRIGQEIGIALPGSASRKDVAIAVLTHFKDNGLFVYRKNKDSSVEVITTKISEEKYKSSLDDWNKRDDDAFTPKGRKEADALNNPPRPRIYEE